MIDIVLPSWVLMTMVTLIAFVCVGLALYVDLTANNGAVTITVIIFMVLFGTLWVIATMFGLVPQNESVLGIPQIFNISVGAFP